MFQRLKGVIDTRIAEEQARQRASQTGPNRSESAVRRPASRNGSPARRQLSQREKETLEREGTNKGPDPAEFESAFAIGDEETLSRASTPKPGQDGPNAKSSSRPQAEGSSGPDDDAAKQTKTAATPPELPPDVKAKLRRLDKLGAKYQELLRSYRIAHARVLAIEPFEVCLRENTPLTSINEPNALVEYLNQLNLQGDMVMQELKRVTSERDDLKRNLADAEKRAKDAHDEAAVLRKEKESNGTSSARPSTEATRPDDHSHEETPKKNETTSSQQGVASPSSAKSPSSFSIGRSLFSPKQKPQEHGETKESEEFFSYDNELPRVQSELKTREEEVENYKTEVKTLKSDLAAAKESTESMTQSLEKASRELEGLRDAKKKHQSELQQQRSSLEKTADELREKLNAAEHDLASKLNDKSTEEAKANLQAQLTAAEAEIQKLKEDLEESQKETRESKELEEKISQLEGDIESLSQNRTQSDKRIDTLNGIITTLREQLANMENNQDNMSSELSEKVQAAQDLRQKVSALEEELKTLKQKSQTEDVPKSPTVVSEAAATTETTNASQTGQSSSKKKNRKKKKGGKSAVSAADSPKTSEAQSPSVGPEVTLSGPASGGDDKAQEDQSALIKELQTELDSMKSQLDEKEKSIDRLSKKLKGEEELREEIEGLKDDLVEVGQEHVKAKAQAKALQVEKSSLLEKIQKIEQELDELKKNQESNAGVSQKAHDDLVAELEDFKGKTAALQKELEAAENLAASRFRELAELKEILQKAQPELTSLRTEVTSLRAAKTELAKRESDIRTLESRQENLRSEISSLRKEASERDADIRNLREKADQESNGRIKAESTTRNAQSDLRKVEGERQAFADQIENISKDLVRARDEASDSRSQAKDLERRVAELTREARGLSEEIELKTAQHSSAQSLMGSMRDQTAEMAMQMKEARDRCESLEEELGDAHRLLSERSREGETMRRLLTDVESRADAKVREMRERMEVAIEERDRAEEEASTVGRKRAREVEELRSRVREAERSLKQALEDKQELASSQKEWQTRRADLERKAEQAVQEVADIRKAMAELRDALDESENQARDFEKQKGELKRAAEDANERLEKLQKANKSISEELRTIQAVRNKAIESETTSTRTSRDSSPQPRMSRIGSDSSSPIPPIDYIYLKNVLLQFMEQKEKKHQMQLVPVLATLLHFDRKDEQKWMSAISSR